jgi:PPM family protein phosphatase
LELAEYSHYNLEQERRLEPAERVVEESETSMPSLDIAGATDRGLLRANNEDNLFFDPELRLAMVADGMGGAACGEIASQIAVDTVARRFREPHDGVAAEDILLDAIQEANRLVLERSKIEKSCRGMGTTIVAALWNLPQIQIANVGDSRAYLLRGGQLAQLSHDQTLVNELRIKMGLTEEQVDNFPHKNVLTMAIGSADEVLVCTREETLEDGDYVLLCSDGLTGPVKENRIAEILGGEADLDAKVRSLIEAAKQGGAPDNITVILLAYRS